jgi:DnaJ-class molecular chaperone
MTRREAALILGVRQNASKERIREAHRRVLMLNHPDTTHVVDGSQPKPPFWS